jgi:hypothetical protein
VFHAQRLTPRVEAIRELRHAISSLGRAFDCPQLNSSLPVPVRFWPSERIDSVIFSSKPELIHAVFGSPGALILGRPTVLSKAAADFIRALVPARRLTIQFMGDLDPTDLAAALILAALLPDCSVCWAGINHEWLSVSRSNLQTRYSLRGLDMPQEPAEIELWPVVAQALDNPEEILGPTAATLLNAGRKVEIEGILSELLHGPRYISKLKRAWTKSRST